MKCSDCGGLVFWCEPITAITRTECQDCGAIDNQSMDGEFGHYEEEE